MSEWLILVLSIALACGLVLGLTLLKARRVTEGGDPSETPDVIEYMTMMLCELPDQG